MDFADFGRYLSQQRELRGMSREEVSRITKIPPTLLSALEAGELDRMPARVFVVNYVKAYAQVIGLSADEALLRLDEVERIAHSALAPLTAASRKKKALVSLGLLALGLVAAGCLLLFLWGKLPMPPGR